MEKYIEVKIRNQVDRYHIKGITVDDFIDIMINPIRKKAYKIQDISQTEFESHPNSKWFLEFNVDDKFEVKHYVSKHPNKTFERQWKRLVEQTK